jgi:TolA-binding protein
VASFINEQFVPVEAHIKEHPVWFRRFNAVWTPTVIVLDSDGQERWRIEGYLPKPEFRAQLETALARIVLMRKHWPEADQRYNDIIETYPDASVVPEAIYWRGVSRYRQTNDHAALEAVARELKARFPESLWRVKASVWET